MHEGVTHFEGEAGHDTLALVAKAARTVPGEFGHARYSGRAKMKDCNWLHETLPRGAERHHSSARASDPGDGWLSALLLPAAIEADLRK
jgi:hypothetical protein